MKLKDYQKIHPKLFNGKRFISSKSDSGIKIIRRLNKRRKILM